MRGEIIQNLAAARNLAWGEGALRTAADEQIMSLTHDDRATTS